MRAERAIAKVDRDYARYIRNMNIAKNRMDRASDIYNSRQEGIAKGEVAGYERANLEIARKMKKAGKAFSEIVEFTGLTAESIEKLN